MTGHAQVWVLNPTINSPVGRNPESITIGDFNRDGRQDVLTVNSGSDDATILLGNGNGTFQSGISFGVGESPMYVATGDLNGDEITDLAVASAGWDSVLILLGKGNGFFVPPVRYSSGKGPTFLALHDIDGDRDLDVIVVNSGRFGHYSPYSLAVFRNNGQGLLGDFKQYETENRDGMFPTSVYAADLTGDGLADLAVTWSQESWRSPNGLLSLLTNRGDGTFQLTGEIRAGSTLSAVTGADFDKDGDVDLILASLFTDEIAVVNQDSTGRFQKTSQIKVGFSPVALGVGDLNGDGLLDVVVTNRASNSVSLLLRREEGSFKSSGHYGVGKAPTSLVINDFDQDGGQDILVSNSASNDVSVLLSGTVGVPSIAVSTESIDFGEQSPEGLKERKTVTLSNVGLGPLTISNIILKNDDHAGFEMQANQCIEKTLTTGQLCQFHVSFTPNSPGFYHAEVTIWDNAPGGPRIVTLNGTVRG